MILWEITPNSPLKVNGRFGGTCHFNFRVEEEVGKKMVDSGFLLGLILYPEDAGYMFFSISQKTELLLTTALRTSSATRGSAYPHSEYSD
jgi:hypothetical protein